MRSLAHRDRGHESGRHACAFPELLIEASHHLGWKWFIEFDAILPQVLSNEGAADDSTGLRDEHQIGSTEPRRNMGRVQLSMTIDAGPAERQISANRCGNDRIQQGFTGCSRQNPYRNRMRDANVDSLKWTRCCRCRSHAVSLSRIAYRLLNCNRTTQERV